MTVRECRNCSVCIATLCTVVWLHGVHSGKIGLNHRLVAYLHILVQQLHASLLLNRKLLSQFGCIKYNKLPVCCLESAHCQAVQHFYTACITVTKRKLSHLPSACHILFLQQWLRQKQNYLVKEWQLALPVEQSRLLLLLFASRCRRRDNKLRRQDFHCHIIRQITSISSRAGYVTCPRVSLTGILELDTNSHAHY